MARPRTNKRKKPAAVRANTRLVLSTCRALVPLDTAAIYREKMHECEARMAEYLREEAACMQHDCDEAAYQQWLYQELGALFTELRTAQQEARAAYAAYRQEAQRAGVPPSRIDELHDMLNGGGPEEYHWHGKAHNATHGAADTADAGGDDPEWVLNEHAEMRAGNIAVTAEYFNMDARDVEQKLKEMYRYVCRAMHPDAGGGVPPGMEWLWDAAQKAYQDGDAIALTHLETRVRMMNGAYREMSCVAEVIAFRKRVESALSVLLDKVEELQKSPAWQFSQWSAAKKKTVRRRAERELREDIELHTTSAAFHTRQREDIIARVHKRLHQAERRKEQAAQRRRALEEAIAGTTTAYHSQPRPRRRTAMPDDEQQSEFAF